MTDLPIEGKFVPIVQGQRVADATNVEATGAGGATSQAQLETLKADVLTNARAIQNGSAADISSLTSKVNALYPLTPDVDILTAWADLYDPAQTAEEVVTRTGYGGFIDYRSSSDRYQTSGIVFTPGSGVIDYTNVDGDFHRCFGFNVSGPADLTLLSIVDGAEVIPFIDMTAGGTFRVNDYTPSRTQDEDVVDHVNIVRTATAGTGTLLLNGPVSTYTIPDYPADTSSQTRRVQIEFEVLDGGTDLDLRFTMDFSIPNTDVAQAAADVRDLINIGWSNIRPVALTVRYELRIDGSDLVFDASLVSSDLSTLQLRVRTFKVLQSYTATAVIARVDDFQTITDFASNFVFTGAQELVIALHPIANTETMDVVPVVQDITSGDITQLDDRAAPEPRTGFQSIRIPDTIEFRSFLPDHFLRHIDLVSILRDRTTKWVYGLARLEEVTEHAITSAIDLAAGSKLAGTALVVPSKTVVHQSVNTGVGAGGLLSEVTLPTDYFNADYVYVELIDSTTWVTVNLGTELLSQTLYQAGDAIYVDGKNELVWTVASRLLAVKDSRKLISQVALVQVT